MSYIGQYTWDRDKKRKRWIDCEVQLETSRREVRVIEDSKVVYKSQLEAGKVTSLLEGEDVGIGGLILRIDLQENAPSAIPSTSLLPSQPSREASTQIIHCQALITRLKRPALHSQGLSTTRPSRPRLFTHSDDSHLPNEKLEDSPGRAVVAKEWKVSIPHNAGLADEFKDFFYLFARTLAVRTKLCLKRLKFSSLEEYAKHFSTVIRESIYQSIYQSLLQVERRSSLQTGRIRMQETCATCDLIYLSDVQVIFSDEGENRHPTGTGPQGTRLFLKTNYSFKNEEREKLSKGDVWLLWEDDNTLIRPESAVRERYQQRRDRGYGLPSCEGFLWQNVWVVRSLWFSFSQAGLMQIVDIAGDSRLPPVFGEFPAGRTKGALKQKFSAIKFSCDSTHFSALELLGNLACLKVSPLLYRLLADDADNAMPPEVSSGLIRGGKSALPSIWNRHDPAKVDDTLHFILDYFHLNDDQAAVLRYVRDWFTGTSAPISDVVLVHGVFGSGKSHALAAVLLMITLLSGGGLKSLVCSSTNVAVDRILSQVVGVLESDSWAQTNNITSERVVRVGCAAKVDRALKRHLVLQADSVVAAKNDLISAQNAAYDSGYATLLREIEQKEFIGNQRRRLSRASIVGTTCASSVTPLLQDINFDVLILDEASQITEPTALLPIATSRANKLIIVGDPKQLAPIITDSREECPLGVTLFDRLKANHWPCILMRTQYRCHPDIANICNRLYYDGVIRHGTRSDCRKYTIVTIPTVVTLQFDGGESREQSSVVNTTEASILRDLLYHVLEVWGLDAVVGVICFYRPQVQLTLKLLAPLLDNLNTSESGARVRVSTIDAYQGQENDISILLTTRSEETSFLSDARRVNVAISRSKHHLIIFGQRSLFESSSLWKTISLSGVIVQSLSSFIEIANKRNDNASLKDDSESIPNCPAPAIYRKKSILEIEESVNRLRKLKEAKVNAIHQAPSIMPILSNIEISDSF